MSLSATESALLALTPPPAEASQLVKDACAADAVPSLTSTFARSVFKATKATDGTISVGVVFPEPSESSEEDLLALAVASLHAFAQINWTGPNLTLSPLELFPGQVEGWTEQELNEAVIDSLAYCGEPVYHLARSTTFLSLALQIIGLIPTPFSLAALKTTTDPVPSAAYGPSWSLASLPIWRLRAGIVWLKVLDEPVPLPPFVTAAAVSLRQSLPTTSAARAHLTLSLSLLASLLSRSSPHSAAQREASVLAREAATETGLEWLLTGRMGKRTKWQVDEKTQLVVLARDRDGATEKETVDNVPVPEVFALNDDTLLEKTAFTSQAEAPVPEASEASKVVDEDALAFPEAQTTDSTLPPLSQLDPSEQPNLASFSQSVLLALSISTLPSATSLLNLHADVLSTAQVSAFVARVLSHPSSWSTTSMALLLRCRAEAGRSRTVERGVLQMQALVDQLRDGSGAQVSAISSAVRAEDMAVARDRLAQFHALAIPPAWDMEKELATRYLSLGISKSALEIFTRLEMWEEVARCWVSLERPEKGVEVIKDLLKGGREESDLIMEGRKGSVGFKGGEKREAKLWCILGELENNPEHYERAWEVSKHTSSRAKRSLGAVYWAQGDWAKARVALAQALAINPLFPRTWFVLGCCAMRAEDWKAAQEAFGRCVGLEDEDAESWSNLASCHLRRGENEGDFASDEEVEGVDEDDEEIEGVDSTGVIAKRAREGEKVAKERLPFSRKRAAYYCLKQAIKHSYDSWRMWYNYMIVAVDVGEMSEACRALDRLVMMRADKDGESAVDLDVLSRLVDAVTRDQGGEVEGEDGQPYIDPNVGKGLAPRVERLISVTIIPRLPGAHQVFLQHARLLLWSGDFAGALDAHLKAYRAGVVTDATVEHDIKSFRAAAQQVEDVVGMLENFGPKEKADGTLVEKDWKFQARSLIRTFLGRTKDSFGDEEETEKLKELMKDFK